MQKYNIRLKKVLQATLLILLLTVAGTPRAMAQQRIGISKSIPAGPDAKLIFSNDQHIVIDFTLGGFELTRVNTPNGIQQVVSVPKMASMLEANAPDLPHFPIPVIIGDLAEMEVNVTKSDFTDYENVEIAPSKGNFSRQINPDDVPYTYGAMYSQNAFYPSAQAVLEKPYILRDFRGQDVMVRPFAYNPVTKTLRVYHHLTIEMTKVSDNGTNPKTARRASAKVSPETKAAYEHHFLNYEKGAAKYTFIDDLGEMLVICANNYVSAMQPFVDWKNQSGRPTTMVSVTQAGGNSDTQIKNYISGIYNDPNRNLAYILFVGDYSDITPHSMSGGRSDNWFGQLEGSDYYPELLVGRFSVQSITDVQTHVQKVLYYERDMPVGLSWLNRGIGIGANEGAGSGHMGGEADYQHIDFIRDTLLHYTYGTVTQQYSGVGSGTSAAAISADVNNGASIINYCNHGSQTSWGVANYSNSHVNALVNDNKWPFIWSVACNNGQFDGTCFAEAWLRATNNTTGVPTGAIGGMFSWISQPWTPPQTGQDEMVDILTEWKNSDKYCHTLGAASLNGSMYILDMHPSDNGATHNTWLLFGDPSLMVRTANPVSMNVSCNPAALMLGMSSLQVNVQNTAFGIATLMMDGEVLASGYIHNNTATLQFAPLSNVGTATLTVVGYNKKTEILDLMVNPAEGAYMTVTGCDPVFAPVNQETNLSMSFKNVGADPTEGITSVTINCSDSRLSILDGTAEFDVLPADGTVTLTDAFSYIVAQGVEDGTLFQIDVTMTCGDAVWTGQVFITAGAALLEFDEMLWSGVFVPGGTVPVVARFRNTGHWEATGAVMSVTTSGGYATVASPTVSVGTVAPGGYATGTFSVSVSGSCPQSAQIPLSFSLTADGGVSAQGTGVLKNSCNVVFELSDSYGDGWNGNVLNVAFSDGSPTQSLTFSSGSSATYTLEIGNGVHVTLSWTLGSWTNECSFVVSYEGGDVIYQASNPSSGVLYQFDCNCAGDVTWYDIAATASPAGAGTVSGTGSYMEGETCTLTAMANSGYAFVNWTENGTQVSTNPTYTFTVTGNRTLVANFEEVGGGYHWDVNIHTYPNTLIMVGVVLINGEEQATEMLEVGAFCNGECRGRERLSGQYYQIFGRYFVNLTVYGEDGDEITFRLYDHATETELDLTCASIAFATNAVFGNPVTPHVFDFGPNSITQTTDFAEGWNWWSTYIDQSGIDGLSMLEEGLGGNGVTVKSQGDGFVQYMNYGGYAFWYGTLTSISNVQTYMVQTDAAVQVEMTGAPVATATTPITISEGWNWIGFPSAEPMDFETAFSGITPSNNDIVKSQNSFAQYMEYGGYGFWYGGLNSSTITPGTGLMYKSENPDSFTFTYPANGRATIGLEKEVIQRDGHWESDVHAYPNNMTVVAVIEYNGEELRSEHYELGVFADGECRGSVKLSYMAPLDRYMAFLTITGEDAVTLNFGLYDETTGEENFDSDASLVFTANAAVGDAVEPYVIGFRGTTGIDDINRNLQVYPNPIVHGERFSIGLPIGGKIQVDIVNAFGAIVYNETLTKAPASILAPNTAGIYTIRITVEGEGTFCRKLVVR